MKWPPAGLPHLGRAKKQSQVVGDCLSNRQCLNGDL